MLPKEVVLGDFSLERGETLYRQIRPLRHPNDPTEVAATPEPGRYFASTFRPEEDVGRVMDLMGVSPPRPDHPFAIISVRTQGEFACAGGRVALPETWVALAEKRQPDNRAAFNCCSTVWESVWAIVQVNLATEEIRFLVQGSSCSFVGHSDRPVFPLFRHDVGWELLVEAVNTYARRINRADVTKDVKTIKETFTEMNAPSFMGTFTIETLLIFPTLEEYKKYLESIGETAGAPPHRGSKGDGDKVERASVRRLEFWDHYRDRAWERRDELFDWANAFEKLRKAYDCAWHAAARPLPYGMRHTALVKESETGLIGKYRRTAANPLPQYTAPHHTVSSPTLVIARRRTSFQGGYEMCQWGLRRCWCLEDLRPLLPGFFITKAVPKNGLKLELVVEHQLPILWYDNGYRISRQLTTGSREAACWMGRELERRGKEGRPDMELAFCDDCERAHFFCFQPKQHYHDDD